jgi:predicted transcriptional regulator
MTTTTKAAAEQEISKKIEARWGKPLTQSGWTAIPSVIFERQVALGLDPLDINIILHLAGFWWTAENTPHPAKTTIAAAIGVHPRTIQRRIALLEAGGLIKRVMRPSAKGRNSTNLYDLSGLISNAEPFAQEKMEKKAAQKKERIERSKRKRPVLTVVRTS